MKIGIMGAMPQEVDSILSHMTHVQSVEHGSRIYSDKADHKSAIDFPKFIEKIARHYSEHIVTALLSSQGDTIVDAEVGCAAQS